MPVLLPCLPDPTDIVVQGEQTVISPPLPSVPLVTLPLEFQSFPPITDINYWPIPGALVNMIDWYGLYPRKIGPIAFGDPGVVDWITLGTPTPVSPDTDPTQRFLTSALPLDITGEITAFDDPSIINLDAMSWPMLGASPDGAGVFTPPTVPPTELVASGLIKNVQATPLPVTWNQHLMEVYNESTQKWWVAGVTRNSSGTALGGCRVLLLDTTLFSSNAPIGFNPVIAETVSDGSGNFSFQVGDPGPFQLVAYLAGSPDVAGVSINSVTPVLGS